jgi:penicillin-binding protein 2
MNDCVLSPLGSAYKARDENFSFGGKTGTSQVARITKQQRKIPNFQNLAFHLREHALFVGYAPIQTPKYVVFVLIEHGSSGGKIAAKIARDIFFAIQPE